jgi:AAA+ superfamily predicted ATPase
VSTQPEGPFHHVPSSVGGHFVLNLYAAIFRLLHQTRRFAEVSDSSLEEVFQRFPFLGEYFAEMRQQMPDDLAWDDGTEWWRAEITRWEARCAFHLPLRALAEQAVLTFPSRLAFMLIGLVEEDSRFGTVLAELQDPLTHRRPTLELTGQMMMEAAPVGESDPWTICRPLLVGGLVEVLNKQAPRSEWLLRVPPMLWDAVRGQVADPPANWCRWHEAGSFPDIAALVFEKATVDRLLKVPSLLQSGRARIVVLRGAPGTDSLGAAGAIARATGRSLLELESAEVANAEAAQLTGPFCALANAAPCFVFDLAPGETAELPALVGYAGPVFVLLGHEGGLSTRLADSAVTLQLPTLGAAERRSLWEQALGKGGTDELEPIVDGFHLGGSYISKVARVARAHASLDGRDIVRSADVRTAAQALNRQLLDTLAAPIDPHGSWSDLVGVEATRDKLFELERRCRHRERLLGQLGPAFTGSAGRGVRALFTGASGTGKTLAARILAAILGGADGAGRDLYRVDLAAVINKYIGETEKNLHQVLTRAEALDVLLLLDEGDALLGTRTEVKSANDRYANLETNFLLQRLEHYQGIVIVTTNLSENIDPAFQRRMDVVVPFYAPQPEQRLQILELHLPTDHGVSPSLRERIALRCSLTGSQIRNAALHATLLALEDGSALRDRHLEAGVRSEYRKAGGLCPLDAGANGHELDGGMESFVAAFARG